MSAVKPSVRSTWSVESPEVVVAHMNGRNGYEDSNEEIIAFETENFDAKGFVDAKFQSMTEKVTYILSFFSSGNSNQYFLFCVS